MLITIPEDSSTTISREQYHQPLIHSLSAPVRRLTYETHGRTRIVRLYRPQCGSYGFHLRGGREHDTGFFISHVDSGSEAFSQGLRTGDELIRVNNMTVSKSLHKDVATIVKNSSDVLLEVKNAGTISVNNKHDHDQLSWMHVSNNTHERNISVDSQPTSLKSISSTSSSTSSFCSGLVYVSMKGAGKGTIGCSICKGPEDKPGIFVQKIHAGGSADEAGLRAGDQIFSCNGKSFLQIEFQEAVRQMKSAQCLKMEILRGAGMDFIAGESSGYNSSISSEGDETSENECGKHRYIQNSKSRMITRVNSLYLDANRDWTEIEAEWAEAEVSEKRTKLSIFNRQEPKLSSSKSLLNLSPSLDKKTGSLKPMAVSKSKNERHSANMHRPQSMTNIALLSNKDNLKITFQTLDDNHVNKIVIPPPPKDERSAIMRLDLLSSSSNLKKNSTASLPPNSGFRSLVGSSPDVYSCSSVSSESGVNISRQLVNIPELKSIQISKGFNEPKTFLASRLTRGRNLPKECPKIHVEDRESKHSCANICSSSGYGKFTSKVTIRSCPPPPPPRATSTRLSQERLRCNHRQRLNSQQLSDSPPSSISSGSSHEYPKCDHNFDRRKSSGSLSLSSDESGTWEEITDPFVRSYCSSTNNQIMSPPLDNLCTLTEREISTIKHIPIIPPPPPLPILNERLIPQPSTIPQTSSIPQPPPLPSAMEKKSSVASSSSTNLSLSAALSREIKTRQEQDSNGLKDIRNAKVVQQKKHLPIDPKKCQHEKLMEEFKKAHANMFSKKVKENYTENNEDTKQ